MVIVDLVALGFAVVMALIGALVGFGRGLKFFTKGIFGFIISIFLCYCFGGIIFQLSFVQDLLAKFASLWADKEGVFYDILNKIHAEVIVYYIVLFAVVQILRIIIVRIVQSIAEAKLLVMRIINKVFGIVLFLGMAVLLWLVAFQIIQWIGGGTADNFAQILDGSLFKLDYVFANNPLEEIINYLKGLADTFAPA